MNKSKFILEVLDEEFKDWFDYFDHENQSNEDFIVYNIISLRYESKNKNTEMADNINKFLVENINEFKKLNLEIINCSPYFEEEIYLDMKEKEEQKDDFNEYFDSLETCDICNNNNVKHLFDVQDRSSDEGMSGIFICINDNCPYYINNNKEKRFQFRKRS